MNKNVVLFTDCCKVWAHGGESNHDKGNFVVKQRVKVNYLYVLELVESSGMNGTVGTKIRKKGWCI